MCVPKSAQWIDALRATLDKVYEPTTRRPVPWLLSGEAALALQGVDIEPERIEFRAVSPFAAAYFSTFMRAHESSASGTTIIYKRGGVTPPSEGWRSNVHQRIVAWNAGDQSYWFGRWNVEGEAVQVLHIRGLETDPVSHLTPDEIRHAHFYGMEVPVVPIEVLLAESVIRGQQHVTNRVLQTLRSSGYSPETLSRALDFLPYDKAARLLRLLEIRLVAG